MNNIMDKPVDAAPPGFAPSYLKKASSTNSKQIRILLMGLPGSGKTYSTVMTCPNPIVADFDNSLTNPDVKALDPNTIPFYDKSWTREQVFNNTKRKSSYISDIFMDFLQYEAIKIPSGHTLIVDSLSTLLDEINEDAWAKAPVGKGNEKDGFAFWDNYQAAVVKMCTLFTQLQCHVVLNCHEVEIRDKETGRLLRLAPMVKTKELPARLPQFFSDYIRQIAVQKNPSSTLPGKDVKSEVEYYWQLRPANGVECKTRSKSSMIYVPAGWNNLNY